MMVDRSVGLGGSGATGLLAPSRRASEKLITLLPVASTAWRSKGSRHALSSWPQGRVQRLMMIGVVCWQGRASMQTCDRAHAQTVLKGAGSHV